LSDVLDLIPEESRPSPSRVLEWMKERKLRPHEACAELLLLSGENPIFPKLHEMIAAQSNSESTRRSPLVHQMDPETRELDVAVWMDELQKAEDEQQSSALLDALGSLAKKVCTPMDQHLAGNGKAS
jgi:hypothetical protein